MRKIPIVLCANKIDIRAMITIGGQDARVVTTDDGKLLAKVPPPLAFITVACRPMAASLLRRVHSMAQMSIRHYSN
jgi:hypothetical protein